MDDNGKLVWILLGAVGALLLFRWLWHWYRRQAVASVVEQAPTGGDDFGKVIPFPGSSTKGGCA